METSKPKQAYKVFKLIFDAVLYLFSREIWNLLSHHQLNRTKAWRQTVAGNVQHIKNRLSPEYPELLIFISPPSLQQNILKSNNDGV